MRAAKAANRLGKKPAQVITNGTLVRAGGHFTSSTTEPPARLSAVHTPAGPSMDQMAAEARRVRAEEATAVEQARKNEEKKKITEGRMAAQALGDTPEGLYDDAPGGEAARWSPSSRRHRGR